MKISTKKGIVDKDDSMYGVLLPYRHFNSYIEMLESSESNKIVIVLTNNPNQFRKVMEFYSGYRFLRRIEINIAKKSIKFLEPIHIIYKYGATLGIKIALSKVVIRDLINEKGDGYYSIEAPIAYRDKVVDGVNRLLKISPQKKYSILDNFFLKNEDGKK